MKHLLLQTLGASLLVAATVPAVAAPQYGNNGYYYDRGGHRHFYNGAYSGGRNGYYGDDRYHQYDRGYDDHYHHGGIGPGKGAAIGGAGGAVLGLLFGGGAKGALIGGAAGAGIGAIAGKEHQNNVRRRDGYYGRPY